MALGPIIAASLSAGLASRPWGLYIAGLDVIAQRATPNGYGVDIESVELLESGPGQVSSLTFVITDPQAAVTVTPGDTVSFMDLTRNVPLFAGWVQTYAVEVFGLGRRTTVTCVGIEVLLDWIIVPSLTVPSTEDAYGGIQSAIAAGKAFGVQPRAAYAAGSTASTLDLPTCVAGLTPPVLDETVTLTNVSLRNAIQRVLDAHMAYYFHFGLVPPSYAVTVDFYGGLRIWDQSGVYGAVNPTDYVDTITVDTGGAVKPSGMRHSSGTGDAVRAVAVTGGNAAGTGFVTDGSGKPGTTGIVNDPASLSDAHLKAAAWSYLSRHLPVAQGRVILDDSQNVGAVGAEKRAGGTDLVISDAQIGLSAYRATIKQITKRWAANNTEEWTLDYGSVSLASQYLRSMFSPR